MHIKINDGNVSNKINFVTQNSIGMFEMFFIGIIILRIISEY